MNLDPKVSWWLNFILFALQSAAGLAWSQYLDAKTAAIVFLALGYISNLLSFAVHGTVPGIASQVNNVGKVLIALAVVLLALFASPVHAADVIFPIKARPVYAAPSCTITSCSGWYAGAGLTGNGSNANIIGNGIDNSVFSAGGILDVHGGYQLWNGTYFAAAEAGLGNEFTKNQTLASLGGQSIVGYEVVKLGMGLSGLFDPTSASPTPSQAPVSVSIPASIAKMLMSPYVVFGAQQRRGMSQWVSGTGAEFLLASGWNLDLRYIYAPSQDALPSTNQVTLGINRHF